MYNPPTFFTERILQEVLSEFHWEIPFYTEEVLCGIVVEFPKCRLYFEEGFESDMSLHLCNKSARNNNRVYLEAGTLIREVYGPILKSNPAFVPPILQYEFGASEKTVRTGLRNWCLLIQTYLLPCIRGNFL